jgi:hypothetical protein
MSTPTERTENDRRVEIAVAQASNGDGAARRYLYIVANAARVLDDLVDGDAKVPAEQIIEVFQALLIEVQRNPFFQKNREYLTALQLTALNCWLDANAWEKSDDATERLYAHVMRDQINELLPAVAYLTGGWSHCRAYSLGFRRTFKKEF